MEHPAGCGVAARSARRQGPDDGDLVAGLSTSESSESLTSEPQEYRIREERGTMATSLIVAGTIVAMLILLGIFITVTHG